MGKPSATEPRGFQLDGHHGIINYFVLGDQVVMTPFLVGSEPVTATSGKYAGISILQHEQNRGLDMLLALDSAQRDKAILNPHKTANYNLTEAFEDNEVLGYAGARVAGFSEPARHRLLDFVDRQQREIERLKQEVERLPRNWKPRYEPASASRRRIRAAHQNGTQSGPAAKRATSTAGKHAVLSRCEWMNGSRFYCRSVARIRGEVESKSCATQETLVDAG